MSSPSKPISESDSVSVPSSLFVAVSDPSFLTVSSSSGTASILDAFGSADPKASKIEAVPEEDETVKNDGSDTATKSDDGTETESDSEIGFEGDDINVDQDDSAGLIANDLDEDEEILPGIPNEDE